MKGWCALLAFLLLMGTSGLPVAAQTPVPASPPLVPLVTAPTLVRVDGQLHTPVGEARTGSVTLVVSLYAEQEDTTPLWVEPQAVTLDAAGRYALYAGATLPDGLPQEFLTGPTPARWLGVGVQGEPESFRMMLVTVPYAVRAREADTLAGKTASDFVLTQNFSDTVKAALKSDLTKSSGTNGASTNGGPGVTAQTMNYLQKCSNTGTPCILTDTQIYEDPITGQFGLGTNAPSERLDLNNPAGSTRMKIGGTGVAASDAAVRLGTGSAKFGFLFGAEYNIDNGFEITPSTLPGGTLFANPALAVLQNGRVGIGTGTPTERLDVLGAAGGSSRINVGGVGVAAADAAVRLRTGSAKTAFLFGAEYNIDNGFEITPSTLPGGTLFATPALVVLQNGNVGVGTTGPNEKLHVVKSGAGGVLISASLQSGLQFAAANGTGGYYLGRAYGSDDANDFFLYDVTNGKRRFGVTTTGDAFFEGNVGIGTTSPTTGRLHVEGVLGGAVYAHTTLASGFPAVWADGPIGVAAYGNTGVEGEGVDGGTGVYGRAYGGQGVYGESGGGGTGVYGKAPGGYGVHGESSGGGYAGYFTGNVRVNGFVCATNVSCASDARLKKDVAPLSYGLREVSQLRPVRWQWKDTTTTQLNLGLVAQDVEPVLPELILRNVDMKGSLGLNYFGFVPVLINAIQEQQDTITALKAENARLDARLRALEQMLLRETPAQ